jgi:hypothetical protein
MNDIFISYFLSALVSDPSLTYPTASNFTLNYSLERYLPWWSNPLMAALIGAIAAGLLQLILELWRNINLKKAKKIQEHSNLLGCKRIYLQYLHSYYLSNIAARSSLQYARLTAINLIDFVPAKLLLESGEQEAANQYINHELKSRYDDSPDLKEALRSRERSENLELRIGDVQERFWRTIGLLKPLFDDDKSNGLIKNIKETEETLIAFDKDITKAFREIDDKIRSEINSICIKGDKYASDPNGERNLFVDGKIEELNAKRKSTNSDSQNKIDDLELKIDKLLDHLDGLLNPGKDDAVGYNDPMYEKNKNR